MRPSQNLPLSPRIYTQFEHTDTVPLYIKHNTLVQSRINVGTASQMVERPYPRVGAMSGVC